MLHPLLSRKKHMVQTARNGHRAVAARAGSDHLRSAGGRPAVQGRVNGATHVGLISKKVLITGASGRVGTELQRQLGEDDIIAKPHEALDITNATAVDACISAVRPDIVINTSSLENTRPGTLT